MKTFNFIRILALPLIALAAAPAFSDEAKLLEEARGVSSAIPPKLLNVLDEEIKKGGPEGAIGVCRDKAPAMAKAASEKSGWAIRRVSLKNRNPKAVPDAWEEAVLKEFDKRAAAGEKPTGLEKGEVVTMDGKQVYRYMKALPTQDLCLNCHGTPDRISPAVQAKLKELYPADKAVGYHAAEIRGAITIKKPL
ncbi:MAG: DUF3365 domain-containing protein [Rhodocyclaceae bacterium]|nr:DUF3365 domain-containing protein [Rhodocyclaceae bacterium]MCB1891091.1 DUF3365 domain-containing protein [Rhodocyclaceae bacterium]MCP5297657.1 DUF3365 domain-containing protein [Zoogloeaceae bacterium]